MTYLDAVIVLATVAGSIVAAFPLTWLTLPRGEGR